MLLGIRPVDAPEGSAPAPGARLGFFAGQCWACDRNDARVTTWTVERGWQERSPAVADFSAQHGSVAGLFSRQGQVHLVSARGAIFRWDGQWQGVAAPHARLKNVILQAVYDPTRDCLVAWVAFRPGVSKKRNPADEVVSYDFVAGSWSKPHKSLAAHPDLLDEKKLAGGDTVHAFDLYFDAELAAVVRLGRANLSVLCGSDWQVHQLAASSETPRLIVSDPAAKSTVLIDLWNEGRGIGDAPTGRLFRLAPSGLSLLGEFAIAATLDVRTCSGCYDGAGHHAYLLDSNVPHPIYELDLAPALAAAAPLSQQGRPARATLAPIRLYSCGVARGYWFCDPQPAGLRIRRGLVGALERKEESIALEPAATAAHAQGLAQAKQRDGYVRADGLAAEHHRMLLGRAAFPLSLLPIKLARPPFDTGPVGAVGGPPPVSASWWPRANGRAMTCLVWFQTVGLFNDIVIEDVHGVAVFADLGAGRVRAVEAVGVGESIYRQQMPPPQAPPLFGTIALFRGDAFVELSESTSGFLRREDPLMARAWETLGRDERERRQTNKLGGVVEGAPNDHCRAMLDLDLRALLSGRAEARLAPAGRLRVYYDLGSSELVASWTESSTASAGATRSRGEQHA